MPTLSERWEGNTRADASASPRSFTPDGRRAKEQHVCATHVDGCWYQDNLNSSFSHTASYNFDNVNRLTGAVATGNSTYNQSYGYTA
ncbi:MAG: hypothetical protein ACLQVM_02200, partial [Terriglobia bacterium]